MFEETRVFNVENKTLVKVDVYHYSAGDDEQTQNTPIDLKSASEIYRDVFFGDSSPYCYCLSIAESIL